MHCKLIENLLSPAAKQSNDDSVLERNAEKDGNGSVRKNLGRWINAWSSTMAVDSSISRVARDS